VANLKRLVLPVTKCRLLVYVIVFDNVLTMRSDPVVHTDMFGFKDPQR
jgi:hypothetical protein